MTIICRSHDPKGLGVLPKETFINIVKGFLPVESVSTLEVLTAKLMKEGEEEREEEELVVYAKFLSLFDKIPKGTKEEQETMALNNKDITDSVKEVSTPLPLPLPLLLFLFSSSSPQVHEKLTKYCRTTPGVVMNAYEVLDPKNTNRITPELFQQILFR